MRKQIVIIVVLLGLARFALTNPPYAVWKIYTLDSVGNVGYHTSIALDSNNKVHISYIAADATNIKLKYATNVSGSWAYYTLDSTIIMPTSIAIDSNDKVHISYKGDPGGGLNYATNASGDWNYYIIDSSVWVGYYSSIAIDSNDKVHISYYDYENDSLKYATNASGDWNHCTIDSSGWVGKHTSIAIDSNNKVHISYYDYGNGDLKYATNVNGSWQYYTVDSTGDVGLYSDIALDSSNKAHISYFDETNEDLKYATNASGSWVVQTLHSTGTVGTAGYYPSIAIDSNDKVHISYYYSGNYEYHYLNYVTNAPGSWNILALDSSSASSGDIVGLYTSIAIDSNNKVHISYCRDSFADDSDLKYVTNASTDVELSDFWLVAGDGKIIVRWKTSDEENNAGWNLYRTIGEYGEYTKINDSLIEPYQYDYTYVDNDVENGTRYCYKLEAVDLDGSIQMFGPKCATPEANSDDEDYLDDDSSGADDIDEGLNADGGCGWF